jgi:hypothetical protein
MALPGRLGYGVVEAMLVTALLSPAGNGTAKSC